MTNLRTLGNDLGLRPGDWVEVKSADEVLATLDNRGCLDALPFMPEMLQYCGKRFAVAASAHKTCDTIGQAKNRLMTNAVHLDGLRCDGMAHDGCQARCLIFWKTAWLKPAAAPGSTAVPSHTVRQTIRTVQQQKHCDLAALTRATRAPGFEAGQTEERYSCQATDLTQATTPVEWWDPRQYVKDLVTNNVRPHDFIYYVSIAAYNVFARSYERLLGHVVSFSPINKLRGRLDQAKEAPAIKADQQPTGGAHPKPSAQKSTSRRRTKNPVIALVSPLRQLGRRFTSWLVPYPYIKGIAGAKTPYEVKNLQPGEIVQVRSKEEIARTINRERRNRGLKFDREMVPYCGQDFRVLCRVEKIINDRNGKMMHLPNTCIILDGVTCSGCLSQRRLFCPRKIYPYWREIWLKRVPDSQKPDGSSS
jgi:hypothetical protein